MASTLIDGAISPAHTVEGHIGVDRGVSIHGGIILQGMHGVNIFSLFC